MLITETQKLPESNLGHKKKQQLGLYISCVHAWGDQLSHSSTQSWQEELCPGGALATLGIL